MSWWNSTTGVIVEFSTTPWPDYPNWMRVDCGCCAGLEWGGETPRECNRCNGNAVIAKHSETGVEALYPGGPFV